MVAIAVGGGGSGSNNRFKVFLFFSVKLLFTRIVNNQFDFGHSGGGSGYIEWAETSIAGHFALVGSSNCQSTIKQSFSLARFFEGFFWLGDKSGTAFSTISSDLGWQEGRLISP